MLHVGFENYVSTDKIIAIANYDSAPMKKARVDAQEQGKFINLTFGKRTLTLIFLNDGYVVGTFNKARKLNERLMNNEQSPNTSSNL